jgi:23S rRNA (guanine745-N1)-methyltransferase
MNKLTRSALYLSNHEIILKCPICDSSIKVDDLKSIVCPNRHTFDIAKQGYLNLVTHPIKTNYDRVLFEARRKVIVESELYRPFHTKITNIISEYFASKREFYLVDMGAGEGSHLYNISNKLQSHFNKNVTGVGLDISKDGILEAAKNYEDHIWIVADLAKTPLTNGIFDIMLNILSPSNYEEFNRLLKDDGIIIKVVPRKDYLKELRQYFYRESEKKDYSNEKVIELFKDKFELVNQSVINYTSKLDEAALQALVKMTPLTWGVEAIDVERFLESSISNITVDLDIMIGRRKCE